MGTGGAESLTPLRAAEILAGLGVLALALFYVLLFIFAQLTGWRRLARSYAVDHALPRARYSTEGVVLGRAGLSAPPLAIFIDDDELALVPFAPLRPAFAPVAIPWNEIVATDSIAYQFFTVFRLTLAHGGGRHGRTIVGILPGPVVGEIERRLAARGAPAA